MIPPVSIWTWNFGVKIVYITPLALCFYWRLSNSSACDTGHSAHFAKRFYMQRPLQGSCGAPSATKCLSARLAYGGPTPQQRPSFSGVGMDVETDIYFIDVYLVYTPWCTYAEHG